MSLMKMQKRFNALKKLIQPSCFMMDIYKLVMSMGDQIYGTRPKPMAMIELKFSQIYDIYAMT